jgi:hypothetical protein
MTKLKKESADRKAEEARQEAEAKAKAEVEAAAAKRKSM